MRTLARCPAFATKDVAMPSSDLEAHRAQIEKLMEISVTLADYTESAELVAQIPAYLARAAGA